MSSPTFIRIESEGGGVAAVNPANICSVYSEPVQRDGGAVHQRICVRMTDRWTIFTKFTTVDDALDYIERAATFESPL